MALERWMPGHLVCLSVCLSVLLFCPSSSLVPTTLPPSGLPCRPLFLSGSGSLVGWQGRMLVRNLPKGNAIFLLPGFFSPSWVCTLPGLLGGPPLLSSSSALASCSLPGLSWVPVSRAVPKRPAAPRPRRDGSLCQLSFSMWSSELSLVAGVYFQLCPSPHFHFFPRLLSSHFTSLSLFLHLCWAQPSLSAPVHFQLLSYVFIRLGLLPCRGGLCCLTKFRGFSLGSRGWLGCGINCSSGPEGLGRTPECSQNLSLVYSCPIPLGDQSGASLAWFLLFLGPWMFPHVELSVGEWRSRVRSGKILVGLCCYKSASCWHCAPRGLYYAPECRAHWAPGSVLTLTSCGLAEYPAHRRLLMRVC